MRKSELMRRRANMSVLDLGRIESDLEAIGEISQKEIWPFILCLHVSFGAHPHPLKYDLLMSSEPVPFHYYPYPHMHYPLTSCKHLCMFN